MNALNINNLIRKIALFLVLNIFLLPGCQKEFLEENPKNAISEAIYWKTQEDAYKALMGVYNAYYTRYAERITNLDKSMIWMSAYAGYASWRTFAHSRDVEIQPTHGSITTMWQRMYIHIARANYFLDNIAKVEMDESEKATMIAEVRFLRAFSYFWLSQTFGNVPLPTTTLTFDEANKISQSSEEEVRDFILDELTDIVADLPLDQPVAEKGRIEKGAALALIGRLLMVEKRWTEAAAIYKQIMDLNRYEIDPRFKKLFEDEGEVNSEFIFVNKYMENEFGETMTQHNMRSSLYGGYNACCVFQHLVDAFLMNDGMKTEVSTLFDPSNPFDNRDPRLYATVLLTGYSVIDLPGSTESVIFQGDPATISKKGQYGANISGYLVNKFWDREYTGNRQYYGGDYPQIRYAEVLLSYLESKMEAGEAITRSLLDETINRIRQRPEINMPPVTETNAAALREIIRNERFVELCFEGGIRYFDLRRWGILKEEVDRDILGMKMTDDPANYDGIYNINEDGYLYIGHLKFYDHNYLWPIPESELNINLNIKQNPGYY
jgi:hypothetical protein